MGSRFIGGRGVAVADTRAFATGGANDAAGSDDRAAFGGGPVALLSPAAKSFLKIPIAAFSRRFERTDYGAWQPYQSCFDARVRQSSRDSG